jgi:hypothetical protein
MKLRFPLLTSALLVVAIPAAAQENEFTHTGYYHSRYQQDPTDSLRDAIAERFETRMEEATVRFWEPRLNSYKHRFDEIFGVQDLVGLNELRVRFSMFVARSQKEQEERRARRADDCCADTVAAYMDTTTTTPTAVTSTGEYAMDTAAYVEPTYTEEELQRIREEEERQADEWDRQRKERKAAEMAEMEQKLSRGEEVYDEEGMLGFGDWIELPAVSKWMARRYRSNLDNVTEQVFTDLRTFSDTLRTILTSFETSNASDIAKVPDVRERLENKIDLDELTEMMPYPSAMRYFYVTRIEPWLLLYDGSGLSNFFSPMTKSVSMGAIPAVSLSEQNSPNPASQSTSIVITLPEASSATSIRVFNAQGEEVMKLEQGALDAGNHAVAVDVSNLPAGSYLYQVSAQLPAGEKMSSRVMQVVQ